MAGGAPELEGLAASVAPRLEAIAADEYKLNTNLKINLMQLELFCLSFTCFRAGVSLLGYNFPDGFSGIIIIIIIPVQYNDNQSLTPLFII